ncbi:universal stress protein [Mucilaginibacter pedocola]|uniref:UspA domain-containing protein n=1 Tax=Mucilaginibacter pedocola TaxID=1792845 RepID=A0A1S9PLW1_9SPHI|nr:universal stress protein [Mucilaginibacter pedocola]OOQ61956.1 hypothetical protein BC343_02535 [Mucilaginibacter pedocola]
MNYHRILIVTEDNPSALKAARCGYELAMQLKAKVALVGVVEQGLLEGDVDAGIFPAQGAQSLKKDMEVFLEKIEKDYSQGTDTERFAPAGEIQATILQLAKEWEADLIVAGTHGRKGLNRLLMGSMAEGILRESTIPVFIVPMDKA